MSMKYLGETFDLHAGGVDLIFPHHENEIAQSECGTGKPFARHWMHVEHLLVDNETMSKSKGNFFTIPDLLARGPPARGDPLPARGRPLPQAAQLHAARGCSTRRRRSSGSTASCAAGRGRPARARGPGRRGASASEARSAFDAALADDLNTPEALAAVHGLVSDGNALLAEGALTRGGCGAPPGRDRRDGRGVRRAPARRRGGPPLARGAGALRRAAGRAQEARVRAGRRGAGAARGAGNRARGHAARARDGGGCADRRRAARAGRSGAGPARTSPAAPRSAGPRDPRPQLPLPRRARSTSSPATADTPSSSRSRSATASPTARRSRPSPSRKRRRIVRAARLYAASHGLTERADPLRRGLDRLGARRAPAYATTAARSTAA